MSICQDYNIIMYRHDYFLVKPTIDKGERERLETPIECNAKS